MSRRLALFVIGNLALLTAATVAYSGPVTKTFRALPGVGRWTQDFVLRWFVLLGTVLALAALAYIYLGPKPPSPLVRSDGEGYYVYLPAYVIHHDPTLRAVAADLAHGVPAAPDLGKGLTRDPATGNFLDRFPIGEAILMLPFFLVGHLLAIITGSELDGYSRFEQALAGISGLLYMFAGVWVLRSLLMRYFTQGVVLATLVSVVFGTNVFHYATYDAIFSHAYSFFLITLLVLLTVRFYEDQRHRIRDAVVLGVIAGLIVLVRNQNALVLLLVPLLGVGSVADVRNRLRFIVRNWFLFGVMAAVTLVLFVPQMLVWHVATGRWLVFSYEGYGGNGSTSFMWTNPTFPAVLTSFNPHGLLPWAPILIFAIAGFIPLRRMQPRLFYAVFAVAVLNLYVIASWFAWHYGGGFGHRQFVDTMALAALPLAAFYAWLKPGFLRGAIFVVASAFILATTIQAYNYWQGLIPFAGLGARSYFRLLFTGQP
ncbi:MAG TPA: hypothetical protein VG013_08735 [Gemmataceae bacterium]|nr:hypothetical protein [Gemmataceae bacterium]